MRRLLILTAGFGEGHNAAARNLAAACDSLLGPCSGLVRDPFALASPRLNNLTRKGYLSLINRAPRLWSSVYRWLDSHPPFPAHLWFLRKEMRVLTDLIAREKPSAILSTYPVFGFMLDALKLQHAQLPPYFAVVTDSISIHSLWTRPSWQGWYSPNSDTSTVLHSMGVPSARVFETGFPVQSFFKDNALLLTPPSLRAGHRPRVLMISHSGLAHTESTAQLLMRETDWELTFALGRDESLRRRLTQLAARRTTPTQVLGWTDQLPRLLMTHHAVISKAGGATTQESIAAHCPLIVNQIVPGQEEGNYELLRRRGIGACVKNAPHTLSTLQRAFAHGGTQINQWRQALAPLARRSAAEDIIKNVCSGF